MKPPRNSSDGRLMVIVWSWLRTPALRFPSLGPDEKSLRGLLLEPANEEPGRAVSERKPSFPPVSRTVAAHMVRTHGALREARIAPTATLPCNSPKMAVPRQKARIFGTFLDSVAMCSLNIFHVPLMRRSWS